MTTLLYNFKNALNNKNTKITDLLREAYIIARNSRDNEKLKWIENELNGYSDIKKLPDYRTVSCDIYLFDMHRTYEALESENGRVHILKHCTKSIKDIENFYNNSQEFELKMDCKELSGKFQSAIVVVGKEELKRILDNVKEVLTIWAENLENSNLMVKH